MMASSGVPVLPESLIDSRIPVRSSRYFDSSSAAKRSSVLGADEKVIVMPVNETESAP
jgi:hypothetical protein